MLILILVINFIFLKCNTIQNNELSDILTNFQSITFEIKFFFLNYDS